MMLLSDYYCVLCYNLCVLHFNIFVCLYVGRSVTWQFCMNNLAPGKQAEYVNCTQKGMGLENEKKKFKRSEDAQSKVEKK